MFDKHDRLPFHLKSILSRSLLLYGTSLLIYTLSLVRAHAAQELHKTYIVAKGQDHSAVFERVNLTADNGRQVPVRGSYIIKLHLIRITAKEASSLS